ncbi:putative metallo-beta-lactamase superfamily protein [Lyophyllum shimeji]|uniref:Metallo-beta-lactamase superfamily protein n=1 Tax=Lyophyllum shimeji TaxID=47721 RepID=A0A9P3PHE3_LYOSH|nr:putative metallo-beta-lactamase superfamily protein [Lyophyllum shimeji]
MEQLEVLPSISRLSDHVVRVLGQNPGKFTLQGTNTYVIGKENPYTLIDTGEGRDEYIPLLESVLRETAKCSKPDEPDVADIILSHWHGDHVGGLPSVLSLLKRLWVERNPTLPFRPPRLHKCPNLPDDPLKGHNASTTLPSIISALPLDAFSPTLSGRPFHDLHDTQVVAGLHVLHTPGHTSDSICLYIPQDKALYTADTVLGQGTAVFEDLSSYLKSLNKMLNFNGGDGYTLLYPGHGPVVPKGKELISGYIQHRLEREAQILEVLKTPPPVAEDSPDSPTHWTTWTIVTQLYAAYPESLWLPAAHGVDLHLRKLQDDGVVKRVAGEQQHTSWELVDILSSSPVDHKASY